VAVVSGRAVEDVRERAGVEDAYCAGNHGLELHDGNERSVHPRPTRSRRCFRGSATPSNESSRGDDGVIVEDKGVTATVHYRQADVDREAVQEAVEAALDDHDGYDALRITEGKQIVELRPDVDWGRVYRRTTQGAVHPDDEQWLTVYLGDDTTDEAAFEVLGSDGVAVAVGPTRTRRPRRTS